MNRRLLIAVLAALPLPALAQQSRSLPGRPPPPAGPGQGQGAAQRSPQPAALTDQDRADLARIETYLDGLRTLTARFVQMDARGGTAEGTLWLQRPGRMRFEYDPPAQILLVADGTFVIFHDKSVRQTSHIPIGATPLSVLLAERIRLTGGDVVPVRVERFPGVIQVTVVRAGRSGEGSITLTFNDPPLELRQWTVVDAQAQAVRVSLFGAQTGGRFDPQLFRFVDPEFFRQQPGN
jgi:outer membrane lipoprotein-sorting protein